MLLKKLKTYSLYYVGTEPTGNCLFIVHVLLMEYLPPLCGALRLGDGVPSLKALAIQWRRQMST